MDIGLNHYGKIHFRLLKTIHWISLIIPIYNTGKFLYKCLDSNIIKGGAEGKVFLKSLFETMFSWGEYGGR